MAIFFYVWTEVTLDHLSESFAQLRRAPPTARMQRPIQVVVLHHRGHWYLVTNFSRLMSQQKNEIRGDKNTAGGLNCCHRCMRKFKYSDSLAKHQETCLGIPTAPPERFARLPSENNPRQVRCEVCEHQEHGLVGSHGIQ